MRAVKRTYVAVEENKVVSLDTLIENLDGDSEVIESILGKFDSTVIVIMNAIEMNAKEGNLSEIISLSSTLNAFSKNSSYPNFFYVG